MANNRFRIPTYQNEFMPHNENETWQEYQPEEPQAQQEEAPAPASAPQPPPPPQARNPFNYEAARDDWMGNSSYDISTADAARASAARWAAAHGIAYDGGDSINLPNGGGWIDIIGNFGGGAGNGRPMARNWTPAGGNGPNPNGQPAGPPSGPPPVAPGAPGGGPPPGISQQLYDLLLQRAKQGTAIDKNDPNIRQQVDPFAAAQERQRRNYLADAAERGGPLVNLRGEQRLAMERAGQATGMFESQLIGRELDSRRAEIQHALDSLGNQLSEDQRLALQRELGYLNDATQRYGIDKGAETAWGQIGLGRDRLGLDYSQFDWDRDPRNPKNFF